MLDGDAARPLLPAMTDLYATVYPEPPYNEGPDDVARYAETLPGELDQPGFSLAVARDGDRLVGLAYGWTMAAGRWWRNTPEPPPPFAAKDKFAVLEWQVHPDYRGRRIGSRLMLRLLDGRPERWATLASNPESRARQMYARVGWHKVGTTKPRHLPEMDLLALDLAAAPISNASP
jgi:GNAT superfamily N-acetyltransferase